MDDSHRNRSIAERSGFGIGSATTRQESVAEIRLDESVKQFAGATDRRDAVRALGAIGIAALAAFGRDEDAAAKKRGGNGNNQSRNKNKNKNKRNQKDNQQQDEPSGPDEAVDSPTAGSTSDVTAAKKKKWASPLGPLAPSPRPWPNATPQACSLAVATGSTPQRSSSWALA